MRVFHLVLALFGLALMAIARPALAAPAILVDVETGHVLYAEDADQRWHPASLTKIMTAYLTFEALRDKRLTLDQKIETSETASNMPASKIGLSVGATISVDLALKSLIVKSANDVAVMLAEAIDGSVAAFADRMNATAARLGMTRTYFVNPNGLPDDRQVTTARDLAFLTRAVLSDFPEHRDYWSQKYLQIGKMRLRSHNALLRRYEGTTGLKTGFICDSGFNIVATAKRNETHLAAVVLGAVSPKARSQRAIGLLEHGFKYKEWKVFLKAPEIDQLQFASIEEPAPSIRGEISVWDCGRRKARPKTRPKAKPKAKPKTASAPAGG